MEVARRAPGTHLVSVDSMQVYRRMDIGTAKPTAAGAGRGPAPLHRSRRTRSRLHGRPVQGGARRGARRDRPGRRPGAPGRRHRPLPPGRRRRLRPAGGVARRCAPNSSRSTTPRRLYERLAGLDPAAAAKIEPTNRRRVVRALEVTVGSGRPFSSFGPGVDAYPDSPVVQIGLRRPRPVLTERIAERVHRMIERGLVDEVRSIADGPRVLPNVGAGARLQGNPRAPRRSDRSG